MPAAAHLLPSPLVASPSFPCLPRPPPLPLAAAAAPKHHGGFAAAEQGERPRQRVVEHAVPGQADPQHPGGARGRLARARRGAVASGRGPGNGAGVQRTRRIGVGKEGAYEQEPCRPLTPLTCFCPPRCCCCCCCCGCCGCCGLEGEGPRTSLRGEARRLCGGGRGRREGAGVCGPGKRGAAARRGRDVRQGRRAAIREKQEPQGGHGPQSDGDGVARRWQDGRGSPARNESQGGN